MTASPPSAASGPIDGAVRLTHSAVLRASGVDAASFLHGQLTNDFTGLGLGEARLAAYCSAKGRMLASFVGFKRGHDDIWLACRADVLTATLKRLRMFVLRAKVQLTEGGDQIVLIGLAGPSARAWLGDAADMGVWAKREVGAGCIVRLPDGAAQARWLWAGAADDAAAVMDSLPAQALEYWDWLEVQSGVAPVIGATVEAFVPQMLNYELVGGVNFQKGCYPGQEVVARSHYRGTIKRRAALAHADVPITAGQDVFWSGDAAQPCGMVALAAAAPLGGYDALLEIKLLALDGGSLHLGSADGPALTLRSLPYRVPREPAST